MRAIKIMMKAETPNSNSPKDIVSLYIENDLGRIEEYKTEKLYDLLMEDSHKRIFVNNSRKLKAEDLEDGTLLKEAVSIFNKERNEEHFIDILEFLRDSYVWIPCNAVMSEADMARFEQAMKDAGDDPSAMVGEEFTTNDKVRLVPDILQNGDNFFFPVFSSKEEMGEYGEHFSKVQKHILEVIPMARNNEKNVSGIVLNAFTEPFVLDAEIFDMVENMKTRLE